MIRSALALAAVTLGVAAPLASAHPRPHGYAHTYPVASSLCSRVAAGTAPKRLAGDTTQITAACTTLSTSYDQTLASYQTAVTPIAGQVTPTRATVRAARRTYVTSIRTARHTFWTTVHALRGAGSLPTDTGTPTAP